jgi:hypothetical protein
MSKNIAEKILQAIIDQELARIKKAVGIKNSKKAFRLKKEIAPIEKLLKLLTK